jgi:hypothetical protein
MIELLGSLLAFVAAVVCVSKLLATLHADILEKLYFLLSKRLATFSEVDNWFQDFPENQFISLANNSQIDFLRP